MELKTRYDIGATAFTINGNIQEVEIIAASTNNYFNSNRHLVNKVEYTVRSRSNKNTTKCIESHLYDSKFDAAKAWLTKQNLEPNDVIQSIFGDKK